MIERVFESVEVKESVRESFEGEKESVIEWLG